MITGIPDYTGAAPVEFSIRCPGCLTRYLIFTGAGRMVGDALGRARERAGQLNARFIDARETPFLACECGEVLDFGAEGCGLVM